MVSVKRARYDTYRVPGLPFPGFFQKNLSLGADVADYITVLFLHAFLYIGNIKYSIILIQRPDFLLPRFLLVTIKCLVRDPYLIPRHTLPFFLEKHSAIHVRVTYGVGVCGLAFLCFFAFLFVNYGEYRMIHCQVEHLLAFIPFPVAGELPDIRSDDRILRRLSFIGGQQVSFRIDIAYGVVVYGFSMDAAFL